MNGPLRMVLASSPGQTLSTLITAKCFHASDVQVDNSSYSFLYLYIHIYMSHH